LFCILLKHKFGFKATQNYNSADIYIYIYKCIRHAVLGLVTQ